MSPENVDALHVYPVQPVTAIETIHELSSCSVSPNVSVLPVLVRESIYELLSRPFPVNDSGFELSSCPVLSQIWSMNFHSLTTRGHSLITLTLVLH